MNLLALPNESELEQIATGPDRSDLADKDTDTLLDEARWHLEQAHYHQQRAVYHWTQCGLRLLELKARPDFRHGTWRTTVTAEVGIPERTAQKMMQLARNAPQVAEIVTQQPDITINATLAILSDEKRAARIAAMPARLPVEIPSFIPCAIEVGDAMDLPLPDGLVDLIVTSPPYGLGIDYADTDDDEGYTVYMQHVFAWAVEMHRVSGPQGRICLNVPLDVTYGGVKPIYADWVRALTEAGWQYRTTLVWNENNVSKTVARGSVDSPSAPHAFARVEVIVVMHKGEWNLRRVDAHDLQHDEWLEWTNGLWEFPGAHNPDHPAPFPEELPRRCITLFSFKDAVVLDPFLGSGTTAVVEVAMPRYCRPRVHA